jgi:hypothetical protein
LTSYSPLISAIRRASLWSINHVSWFSSVWRPLSHYAMVHESKPVRVTPANIFPPTLLDNLSILPALERLKLFSPLDYITEATKTVRHLAWKCSDRKLQWSRDYLTRLPSGRFFNLSPYVLLGALLWCMLISLYFCHLHGLFCCWLTPSLLLLLILQDITRSFHRSLLQVVSYVQYGHIYAAQLMLNASVCNVSNLNAPSSIHEVITLLVLNRLPDFNRKLKKVGE